MLRAVSRIRRSWSRLLAACLLVGAASLLASPCCLGQSLTALLARAPAATPPSAADAPSFSSPRLPSPFSRLITLERPLSPDQSLTVSTELSRFTSFEPHMADDLDRQPSWKFKGVPLTVSLVQKLGRPGWPVVPQVSLGVSYYLCKTTLRDYGRLDHTGRPDTDRGYGMGYGAEAALGLRTRINRTVFVLAQSRLRYVNGFGLTGGSGAFDNEFAKLDFAIGLGFRL